MLRIFVIVAVLLCAVFPQFARAQSAGSSAVVVSHPTLALGQTEKVTVVARDLAGHPLKNAAVALVVRFGSHVVTYQLKRTDSSGQTSQTFRAPVGMKSGTIPVLVTISSGFLRQTLATRFALSGKVAPPTKASATPVATATPPANGLVASASALPPHVVAPNPVYVVVNARSHAQDQPGATVTVQASFKEGTVVVSGTTDQYGVATVKIDTAQVRADEVVKVSASVKWKGATGQSSTVFDISTEAVTPTPTPTIAPSLAAPANTNAIPTPTPVPTDAPPVFPTPTAYPTLTPIATPTPDPSPAATSPAIAAAYPTVASPNPAPPPALSIAPIPDVTNTPLPTDTALPAPTATPSATFTATPTPNCPSSQTGCQQAMLNIINGTRAQYGLYPLVLNSVQSAGTSSCAGSYGHSVAMQQSGYIWHTNASYVAASFPNNVCVQTSSAAENVGQFSGAGELDALQAIHNLMMSEPHDAATCASQINHACSLLTPALHQVGIGIVYDGYTTWLTEDFLS